MGYLLGYLSRMTHSAWQCSSLSLRQPNGPARAHLLWRNDEGEDHLLAEQRERQRGLTVFSDASSIACSTVKAWPSCQALSKAASLLEAARAAATRWSWWDRS